MLGAKTGLLRNNSDSGFQLSFYNIYANSTCRTFCEKVCVLRVLVFCFSSSKRIVTHMEKAHGFGLIPMIVMPTALAAHFHMRFVRCECWSFVFVPQKHCFS